MRDGPFYSGVNALGRIESVGSNSHPALITKSLLLIRELLPPAGPPAALAANGTAGTRLKGKGRLAAGANGKASRHSEQDAAPVNRINGAAKNGKRRELATAWTAPNCLSRTLPG